MAYTLDGANRIRFATHSSGASLYGQSFNSLGQRGKLTWGGSVGYTWDHAGRLGTMTDDLAGAGNDITWTFSYSPASQVVSWSATSTAYDYREYATASVGQSYDGLNRGAAIVSAGGYDLRGNMIKDATRVMSYDAENRFLASAPVATPSSPDVRLVYDPEGRLAQSSSDNGATWTTFEYDGSDLIAEYAGATTTVLDTYVHGPGADEPVVWFEGSGFSTKPFLAPNYQSSVIATADSGGNLETTYEYGPYGEPEINRADPATVNPWTGPRFRYTGQAMLFGARLYDYKARVYDPAYGHFLQTDPIGSKDDLDLYAYTADDPVNGTDPSGNQTVSQYTYSAPATVPTADTDWAEAVDMAAYGLAAISDGLLGCQCGPEANLPGEGFKVGSEILEGAAEDMQATNAAASLDQFEMNKANGAAFENQVMSQTTETHTNVQAQITVVTQGGIKTRLDILGTDAHGNIACIECKASTTAPLTRNQTKAFPEIARNGATVVGKGKPGYPRGTKIPAKPVDVIRKKDNP